MTQSAIHGVELYPVDQIVVGYRHRIRYLGSMPFHRSIQSRHRYMAFHPGSRSVCVGGKQTKLRDQQNPNENHHYGEDHT
jgi:hypothetical protein